MGPTRAKDQRLAQDDVTALLREKDDQIASLEVKLGAYSARASTAQTRLLKTIDVLDALRTQHALEISAEEQAKLKLVHELDRWRSMAKTLEAEKDELKDVVEDLIEKVQVSNEWSSWPCSRMYINKHAEQVAGGTFDLARTNVHYNDDLLAYATSIIARLRTELDFERQSHIRVVEEANLRIEELDAKVAVREAELESCLTSHEPHEHRGETPDSPSKYDYTKQRPRKRIPHPRVMSDEECFRFLESNNARNRTLELEIRSIAERLEQARVAASTLSEPREGPPSPASRNDHNGAVVPRARSASVDSNVLSRRSGPTQPRDEILPASASPSTKLSIAQLDNQIRAMTVQMEALQIERMTLVETAARQKRATNGVNTESFQDILRVEGECIRLQAEVDDLREQLDLSRSSARSREKALLREIAHLRASSGSPLLRPAHDLYHAFSPKLLEDDVVPEESMELATPLQPTIIPAPPSQIPAEADFSSLRFAPERVSSPPPDAPPTPPLPRSSPGSQDIERVQAALDAARAHLAQKEAELESLRVEMEMVRLQVETKGDGDRDEG